MSRLSLKALKGDPSFEKQVEVNVRVAKGLFNRYRVGSAAEYAEDLLNMALDEEGYSFKFYAWQEALDRLV